MVSGLFFGLAFGMGGIGAAVLGELADWTSIELVYRVCSFLPLIGLLTLFLPNLKEEQTDFNGFQSARLPAAQAPTAVRIPLGLENVAGRS